jgi:hypothetical protein
VGWGVGGGLAKAAVAAAAAAAVADGGREIKSSRASGAVAEAADERISFVFGKEVHHSHSYCRSGLRRYVKLNHTVPPRVAASALDCDGEDVPRQQRHHV